MGDIQFIPEHELAPDNLALAERGTRWRCRQCGAERAAGLAPEAVEGGVTDERHPGSATRDRLGGRALG